MEALNTLLTAENPGKSTTDWAALYSTVALEILLLAEILPAEIR